MNSEASKLITNNLRDIRLLITDMQRQEGQHFKETAARILTDVVNVLEAIVTSGGDRPFAAEAGKGPV